MEKQIMGLVIIKLKQNTTRKKIISPEGKYNILKNNL